MIRTVTKKCYTINCQRLPLAPLCRPSHTLRVTFVTDNEANEVIYHHYSALSPGSTITIYTPLPSLPAPLFPQLRFQTCSDQRFQSTFNQSINQPTNLINNKNLLTPTQKQ
jgi:hypothetical protein